MGARDYLRLGLAGIAGHKRQTVMILIVVGVLYSVMMAVVMLIQGVQNSAMQEMAGLTDGKILIGVEMNEMFCKNGCDVEEAKAEIRQHGGRVLEARKEGWAYVLEAGLVGAEVKDGGEVKVMYAPVDQLARMLLIEMPDWKSSVKTQVAAVEKMWERALGKTVKIEGEKYYIAGILPGGIYETNLAFKQRKDKDNPLNIILEQVRTGRSSSIVAEDGVEGDAETVVAEFESVRQAAEYMESAGYCMGVWEGIVTCHNTTEPKYLISELIGDPVGTEMNFRGLWKVATVVGVVLMVIAGVIMLSTYGRLMRKDKKTIALYRAMGAGRGQIVLIYIVYLVGLSLLAAVLALMIGAMLALIVNMMNMELLEQAYVLGFGAEMKERWIISWSSRIWVMIGVMVMTGVLGVVMNLRKLNGRGGVK